MNWRERKSPTRQEMPVINPPPAVDAPPADRWQTVDSKTDTAEVVYNIPATAPINEAPPTPKPADERIPCAGCGRPMPTDHERITDSLQLLGARVPEIVPEFYRRLFRAAPQLVALFADHTPELVSWVRDDETAEGLGGDNLRGWRVNPAAPQTDRVLGAIKALAQLFDRDDPDALERLDSHLAAYGRSHTRFEPAATIEEYAAVGGALLGVLADFAGDAWTPPLAAAWRRAYEYAAGRMLAAQAVARTTGTGRRRRDG